MEARDEWNLGFVSFLRVQERGCIVAREEGDPGFAGGARRVEKSAHCRRMLTKTFRRHTRMSLTTDPARGLPPEGVCSTNSRSGS